MEGKSKIQSPNQSESDVSCFWDILPFEIILRMKDSS